MPIRLVALLLLAATLAACERPFVEEVPPTLRVVAPDLSVVQTSPTLLLQVRADSPRPVERVAVGDTPLTFDPATGLWEGTVSIPSGLTALPLSTEDADGTVGLDTAYALRLGFQVSTLAPSLPQPRGGHTATRLLDDRILVTGGSTRPDGPASDAVFVLQDGPADHRTGVLERARTGHTATLLPDGRVLILGGSLTGDLATIGDLVEPPEVYDPATRLSAELPFRGDPIRRTLHTAILRPSTAGDVLVDLYGGRGDIRYGTDPRLGIRSDLRTFRFTGDSLVAVTSLATSSLLEPVFGHVTAPLRPVQPLEPATYLVAGATLGSQSVDSVRFTLDYTLADGILFDDAFPFMRRARARHAAAPLPSLDGFVGLFGGLEDAVRPPLATPEVYVAGIRRFFLLPETFGLFRRYGHTATLWTDGRILLLGGFANAGNAVTLGELVAVEP